MARYLPGLSATALLSMLSVGAPAHAQLARFDVIDLGPAIGTYGMNEHGAVVGIYRGTDGLYHGFVAQNGAVTDIGSLGGHHPQAPGFAASLPLRTTDVR